MTEPVRADCMGTVPHGEHPFNQGMWCNGLEEEKPAVPLWDMKDRERAVREWLTGLARRPRFQRGWYRLMNLCDAYERGYQHGTADERSGQERERP